MQITKKLNIVNTIHFTLLLTFTFVINFFILKEVINNNIIHSLQQKSLILNQYIDNKNAEWEQSSAAKSASILENNSTSKVELNKEWFSQILSDFNFEEPFSYVIYLEEGVIIYQKDASNSNQLDHAFLQQIRDPSTKKTLKKSKLYTHNFKYLVHSNYNERLNVYVTIFHTKDIIIRYLNNYPLIISIVFVIILLLLLMMLIRTNYRFTRPLTEIVNNLKNSKYVQMKSGTNIDEAMVIQRSIDYLHNQLDFYVKNLEKSTTENKKFDKDIQIAKKLQNNILPKNIQEITQRNDFEIYAISEAAFELGGDFYDYFLIDQTHLVFVIGDIAGKGIPASLYMIFTHTLLRAIVLPGLSVSEITNQLNNKLIEENISDLFVTMLMGILDTETGKIQYCNAAHNLPLVIRESGIIEEFSESHGIPLGIYPNRDYKSSEFQLYNNDQLLIFTDGLIDSKDENDMNFSIDILKYNLMGAWFLNPKQVITKIQDDVSTFRGNVEPADDMTILMLKYTCRDNEISN